MHRCQQKLQWWAHQTSIQWLAFEGGASLPAMSDPQPPPQISPDGKFYWDGTPWVPMQVPQQWVPTRQTPQAAQQASRNVSCVTRTNLPDRGRGVCWRWRLCS